MISESKSSKTDLRSANIILCPKCDCKTQEIDKFYDREIKNLHYLLNFKDLAVRKRDEMILIYIEDINKLKETIKNLNKLVYRLKLQIPDPKNLNKFPNTNNTPYVDTFENDYPGISKLNYNERPISSISENKKRVFSASILKKNQLNPIVKIIKSKDKNICVTATQGLPLQQSLLNDNNKKITIMMENDEKKVLKDPKLKQLEDFYLKNESPLETFNTYKNFAKNEFFDISFSILRDFKTTISQSLKLKKMIKYFQKVIKTLNYQENFYIISKHTADIMECEKCTLFLLDEENQELWTKFKPDDPNFFRIPINKGIIGYVACNNQCIRVDDTNTDPRFNKDLDNYQHNYHLKTLIATPLKDSEGKIIGVLEAVNKLNGVFNKEDEEFINLIGQQTNNILKNCSNYEKVISNCYKMQNLLKIQIKLFQMENGKFEDFQAYVEKTLLEIANCSQASIYLINQKRNVSINKLFEENSLEIGIIGQVALTSESLFLQDCQSYHKFNQLVDFKSNLPVHTYPIKDSNSLIIAVIQLIRFRDILGKKIKKDLEEEDILARFLTCLGVLYEKINVKLKIFD